MAVDLAGLVLKINADSSEAEGKLGALGERLGGLANPAMLATAGFIAAGAAVAVAGVASIKMAGDFQSGMTTLVTGAGESRKNIDMVSQGILKMAVDTGTSTEQLTAGMYMIDSAGYTAANGGLKVLQAAAEGAKVGNADLGATAFALTNIMHDYHLKADEANGSMNALITTVGLGKMHMDDLTTSLGAVLPNAAALGVTFPQVAGALAVMTNSGMTAQRASQELNNVLLSLTAPGAAAQKAMESVGLSAQQLSDDLKSKGIGPTLQEITDQVGTKFPAGSVKYEDAIKAIVGGMNGFKVTSMLTGDSLKDYNNNVAAISDSMKNATGAVQGWDLVQQDFNFKFDRFKEVLQTGAIELGTKLLPAAGAVVDFLSNNLGPTIGNVATILTGRLQPGIQAIETAFSGAGNAMKGINWEQISGQIGNMAAVIGIMLSNAIRTIIPIVENWGHFLMDTVIPAVLQLANWIQANLIPAVLQLFAWLNANVIPAFKALVEVIFNNVLPAVESIAHTILSQLLPPIENLIGKIMPILVPAFHAIGWVLQNVVGPALNVVINIIAFLISAIGVVIDVVQKVGGLFIWLVGNAVMGPLAPLINVVGVAFNTVLKPAIDAVGGALSWLGNLIGNILGQLGNLKDTIGNVLGAAGNLGQTLHIPGFAGGGTTPGGPIVVGEAGPEILSPPGGWQVTPLSVLGNTGAAGPSAPISIENHIYLDGREVTYQVMRSFPKVVQQYTGQRGG